MSKTVQGKRFLNPFAEGVTYEQFLKSIPKGKNLKEHLKGKCTVEQIDWLESEINKFKNKK